MSFAAGDRSGPTVNRLQSDSVLKRLMTTLEMIKIEHTIFALPFAFLGAFLAARGFPEWSQIGWILLAMVGARSAGMAFNRVVDLPFDAKNPRTANRALPQKQLTRGYVVVFIFISAAVLIFAAAMLNPLALKLSPLALVIVLGYSYMKRFTWGTHFFLGLALACAPVGAWVAVRGDLGTIPLLLGFVVILWVAGFDIIYSCQDLEFDRAERLYSIPKRFGIGGALWVSGMLHACMVILLGLVFWEAALGLLSMAGLAVVTVMLVYEHSLVKPGDLSRVNAAFFTINGWISVLLFVIAGADILWHRMS